MKETEAQFENRLVEYLATGTTVPIEVGESMLCERNSEYSTAGFFKSKLWKYEKDIKTTEALWKNFKSILERRNQRTLNAPLSAIEFEQVKKQISELYTPYQAGQFLYGHNGVSEIEIDLDEGRHVFLNIFDQKQIGAGDTEYQIVTQIERPAKIIGKQPRRFDTTLLINGLPVIQIEEKTGTHNVDEALRQMEQYIHENQYSDIFSTVQILVAMTPNDIRYMANTTAEKFNTDFAFRWQTIDCKPVRDWKKFADLFLSIPMAHKMATNYMILDGARNKQAIKVMRPYQVYATEAVIRGLKRVDFNYGPNKVGYVWHTTGSGKTITSFKTAWLAKNLPNVEKVVFLVDRIALTKQTTENYKAYNPEGEAGLGESSSIEDTNNTRDLERKLKSKDNNIIVTSIQKLDKLVSQWENNNKAPLDKNIVFIVDEAHRSTGGDSFDGIQKMFKKAAWVGYTGTPMFDKIISKDRPNTENIFGPPLHQYTIREAIADRNVLGFKVDFETTIDDKKLREQYLPEYFHKMNPTWDEQAIQRKIDNLSPEDIDKMIDNDVYDDNEEHIKLVVEDIFKYWKNRSNNGRYNALFTTNMGGNRSGITMALKYYREFQRVNTQRANKGEFTLKVGITFSQSTDNSVGQVDKNEGLFEAIQNHNKMFDTNFDMSDVAGYTQDVTARLARTAHDKKYYDLVIVVDQLLTGFDAPEMNTLYVDRTLKNASLIQAYSRTNRIENMQEKPWGRIINYRWPAYNERLMNEALSIYANKESASKQKELDFGDTDTDTDLTVTGVIAKNFADQLEEVKNIVKQLAEFSDNFTDVPKSEAQKEEMFHLLNKYSRGMAKLKQYDPEIVDGAVAGFDYENPEQLVTMLGMTPEQETTLTVSLYNQLKEEIAKEKDIPVAQIEFCMTHVKDVKVNYDYLTELVEQLLNQVHENKMEEAKETRDKITSFTLGMEDRKYAKDINTVADVILDGTYPPKDTTMTFPVELDSSSEIIKEALQINRTQQIYKFRLKWGIVDVISSEKLLALIMNHQYGSENDLNEKGELVEIQKAGFNEYKDKATDETVAALSKIKYKNALKNAMYKLADSMVGTE